MGTTTTTGTYFYRGWRLQRLDADRWSATRNGVTLHGTHDDIVAAIQSVTRRW